MRNLFLILIALFSIAPALSATEVTPREAPAPNVISAPAAEPASALSGMELRKVSVAERPASSDNGTAQLGPRGGFWWTVGAIVVAVVIVSVIL